MTGNGPGNRPPGQIYVGRLWHEGRRRNDGVLLSIGVDILKLLSSSP